MKHHRDPGVARSAGRSRAGPPPRRRRRRPGGAARRSPAPAHDPIHRDAPGERPDGREREDHRRHQPGLGRVDVPPVLEVLRIPREVDVAVERAQRHDQPQGADAGVPGDGRPGDRGMHVARRGAAADVGELGRVDRGVRRGVVAEPPPEARRPDRAHGRRTPRTSSASRWPGSARPPGTGPGRRRSRTPPAAPPAPGRAPRPGTIATARGPRSGRPPPRPAPKRNRTPTSVHRPVHAPVSAVNADHQSEIRVSTRRPPIRSPHRPVGISNSPYASVNAIRT